MNKVKNAQDRDGNAGNQCGNVRNAVNQDGDLGYRVGIKRIRLEMRENWGKNKGV